MLYQQVSLIKPHCDIDSQAYLENGLLFARNHSFALRADFPYYALGYPMIIGVLYNIFGEHLWSIILMQIIVALLCGFLIFFIARRLCNDFVALLSFAFFSVNLGFLVFAQFVLTELFLAFFLLLFCERFTAFLTYKKIKQLVLAGLCLGLSIIIKPAALYYFVLLVPLIFYIMPGKVIQKIKALICFACAFYIPVVGYMTHNYYTFDSFKLGNLSEINMLFWFFPHVLAEKNGTTTDSERCNLQLIAATDQHNERVRELFWTHFKQTPQLFVFVWLKNVMKTLLGLFTTNLKVLVDHHVHGGDVSYFKMQGTFWQKIVGYVAGGTLLVWVKVVGFAEAMWSFMRYFLTFLGLIFLARERRFVLLYFFLSYLFYFSMITGHDGCARFRMLSEFQLIILAAVGIWAIRRMIFARGLDFFAGGKQTR